MADPEAVGHDGYLTFRNIVAKTPAGKLILDGVNGRVGPGELLAVMGPSGAGKSTLLDILAGRSAMHVEGAVRLAGDADWDRRRLSAYVEQDDALIGVLSVRETLSYAARLGLHRGPGSTPADIKKIVDDAIAELGLRDVADNRIGTPIQRGISGGQKRRVSIGQAIVTRRKILFLDEPTSGLDSATSREVLTSIARSCREQKTIVVATIHQPAWETLTLFNRLLVLSHGSVVFNDITVGLVKWLSDVGHPVKDHRNPIDVAMELVNTDFLTENEASIPLTYRAGGALGLDDHDFGASGSGADRPVVRRRRLAGVRDSFRKTLILSERNAINYSRSLLSYGIRLGMYVGLGLLLATVWIRLGTDASKINDRLSIYFYSVAFLSFMSVAGIPSFLEERAVFMRERSNGHYSTLVYVFANSVVNLPFLFICSLAFMLIMYWAIGLHSGAVPFWRFTAFLYLAIVAAEAQSLVIAAFVPIFVAALALAAFMNGFWMAVQGFFIKAVNLPRFWYYWAHWIDYETYAFNVIAKSDLTGLVFECTGSIADNTCSCPYPSSLIPQGQCAIAGEDVLVALDIQNSGYVLYGFLIVIIILVYRVLFWLGLTLRKH